jgi:hypothetical protein
MKRPLLYLLLTRFKNQILSLLKSPGKLIYILFMVAMLVLVMITGRQQPPETSIQRDIGELFAGLFVLYLLMFILLAKRGFDSGASLFKLSDVNLVFTAPFRSSSVLLFGLIQQMGTSLLLGFFLVFQFSWLRQLYGISLGTLLLILFGYALTVFLAQLTAMVLYSFTSANEKSTRLVKLLFYGLIALYAGWAVWHLLRDTDQLFTVLSWLGTHKLTRLFPVVGWISSIVVGSATGSVMMILLGSLACLLFLAILVGLLVVSRPDYYEDVLQTTEMNYSAITAQKEGKVTEMAPRNVRLGKVGLNRGAGATAFYHKHRIENRRSRIIILNGQSLIFIMIVIFVSFFMREAGMIAVFAFSTYMQLFSTSLGRLVKELAKPYIYLVPEPSLNKLLQNVRESIPGTLVESLILFIPLALILKLEPATLIGCIIARFTYAYLFTAGNILVERVFGTVSAKVLVFFFYFLALMIMSLPGVVLAIVLNSLGIVLITDTFTVFLALAVTNTAVTLLVFYLCRNMLQYAELNNR